MAAKVCPPRKSFSTHRTASRQLDSVESRKYSLFGRSLQSSSITFCNFSDSSRLSALKSNAPVMLSWAEQNDVRTATRHNVISLSIFVFSVFVSFYITKLQLECLKKFFFFLIVTSQFLLMRLSLGSVGIKWKKASLCKTKTRST